MIPIIDLAGKLTGVTTFDDVFNADKNLDNLVDYINTSLPSNPNALNDVYKRALDQFCTKMVTYNIVDVNGELNIQAMCAIKKISTGEYSGPFNVNGPAVTEYDSNAGIEPKSEYACLGLQNMSVWDSSDPDMGGDIMGNCIVQATVAFESPSGIVNRDFACKIDSRLYHYSKNKIGFDLTIPNDDYDPTYPKFKNILANIIAKHYDGVPSIKGADIRTIALKKVFMPSASDAQWFTIPVFGTRDLVLCDSSN